MESKVLNVIEPNQLKANIKIEIAKEAIGDVDINSDEELFEDAADGTDHISSPPDLESALEEVVMLLTMALNNRFHEALTMTSKWAHESLYHALGKGTLSFLKGCLTLEKKEIQIAMEALSNCVNVCYRKKRPMSVIQVVWRPNYNQYTDEEVHAELCYAEALLMTALLTFLEDQNLINLVKGAFRIRNCYQSYKECMYILNHRTQWQSEYVRKHFESGVRMGIGTFNLMISHMPSKVIKMLEFVGFSGNRATGFSELEMATQLTEGLRCPLAVLIMLCYQCYIEQIFGLGHGDLDCAERLMEWNIKLYPNSAFFLLFVGRLAQLRGKLDEAIENFKNCIAIQDEWRQFHNICYWELLWCHSVQCDWDTSAKYANILRQQCKWSPATYTYQYATFLYMSMIENNRPEMKEKISELLKTVPKLKIRYAGKTVPAEKFAITQSEKYFANDEKLLLPALEFLYIWNIFATFGHNSPALLNSILERVEHALVDHKHDISFPDHPLDDYALLMLLKGMCMRYLGYPLQAEECFSEILKCEKRIIIDRFLPPHAAMELGLTYLFQDELLEARHWLEKSRKEYTGYLLETIVHFRVHCAMRMIRTKERHSNSTSANSPEATTPVSSPEVDCDGNESGTDSRFSSMFTELSKRITLFNGNRNAQSPSAEYEEFLDAYQTKL